ncbi:MAG: hypothetical protein LBG60_02990 [Bifidobacteriaceae bacterium]|nr:hypothetical protein [Bifidobacteriaceae bacterium]
MTAANAKPALRGARSSSIRVSTHTRTTLAQLAANEGCSLAEYMDRLAARARREAAYAGHRSAVMQQSGTQAEAQWLAEQRSWTQADQDGLE